MILIGTLFETLKTLLGGANPNLEEKRAAYRISCHVNVQCKTEQGSKAVLFQALCTDLGTTGVRLEASVRDNLKKGTKLIISQVSKSSGPLGGPIPAEVMWVRKIGETGRVYAGAKFHCAVESLKQTWVGPTLDKLGYSAKAKAAERRRHVRLGSGLPAVVYGRDGEKLGEGRLVDLSGGGAKIEINASIISGGDVKLRIGPGERIGVLEIPASVVQCREDSERRVYYMRSKFVTLEPSVLKALKKYLAVLQRQQASI